MCISFLRSLAGTATATRACSVLTVCRRASAPTPPPLPSVSRLSSVAWRWPLHLRVSCAQSGLLGCGADKLWNGRVHRVGCWSAGRTHALGRSCAWIQKQHRVWAAQRVTGSKAERMEEAAPPLRASMVAFPSPGDLTPTTQRIPLSREPSLSASLAP
eukprot:236148-Chlamydomonas_euryale.AAC.1